MQKFTQSREKRSFFYAKSIFVVNFYTLALKKSIFTHCVKKEKTLNKQYKELIILIKTLNIRNTTKSAEPGFSLSTTQKSNLLYHIADYSSRFLSFQPALTHIHTHADAQKSRKSTKNMLVMQIFYLYFAKKVLSANSILQFDFRFLSIALTGYATYTLAQRTVIRHR